MTRCRRRWILLAVAGGLLLGLYAGRARILTGLAAWLDVCQPPQKADALILFNGHAQTRAFAAAALVKAGWARRVILSTTIGSQAAERKGVVPWHQLDLDVLHRAGIAEKDVVLVPGEATTTIDEVRAIARYLESDGGARYLVVTNGPHSRRTRWTLSEVFGPKVGQMIMVSAPMDEFQADNWWRCESGFLFVVSEYLKLGFYSFHYGRYGYGTTVCITLVLVVFIFTRRRMSRRKATRDGPRGGGSSEAA